MRISCYANHQASVVLVLNDPFQCFTFLTGSQKDFFFLLGSSKQSCIFLLNTPLRSYFSLFIVNSFAYLWNVKTKQSGRNMLKFCTINAEVKMNTETNAYFSLLLIFIFSVAFLILHTMFLQMTLVHT